MTKKLKPFEGHAVQASVLKLSGGTSEKIGSLDQDEVVYFVGCASVGAIEHGYQAKGTYTRTHKANVIQLFVIDAEDGQRMLVEAKALSDDRFGIQQLFREADRAIGHDPVTGEVFPPGRDGTQQLGSSIETVQEDEGRDDDYGYDGFDYRDDEL